MSYVKVLKKRIDTALGNLIGAFSSFFFYCYEKLAETRDRKYFDEMLKVKEQHQELLKTLDIMDDVEQLVEVAKKRILGESQ